MHEMGLWEPKLYIFGNQLYSKNIKKLRLNGFFYFHTRKYITS